jgi:hypothetical protein
VYIGPIPSNCFSLLSHFVVHITQQRLFTKNLSPRGCVYRDVAWQWVDTSQYLADIKSYDSSFGIATVYKIGGRGIGVRFPASARDFSLLHSVQTGSGAHPASYTMGTRGCFPGGKAAGL